MDIHLELTQTMYLNVVAEDTQLRNVAISDLSGRLVY